ALLRRRLPGLGALPRGTAPPRGSPVGVVGAPDGRPPGPPRAWPAGRADPVSRRRQPGGIPDPHRPAARAAVYPRPPAGAGAGLGRDGLLRGGPDVRA